jgi:hypothetical protein
MSTTITQPAQQPISQNSRRSNKSLPLVNFVQSLSYNLIIFSMAAVLFSIPALYTSLIANAGGMTVDSLTAASGKADLITHSIKIFEGWVPPKLVTKHETHLKFDSSSHDYANEKFRTIFPTSIPFGYFIYSVLKSMIDSNYSVFMGLHKMFYKLPESMTFVLAMIFVPLLYLLMYFINIPLSVVFHLYHFKKYFISCVKDPSDPSKCTESEDYGPISWICLFAYGIFGFIPAVMFGIPILTIIYCHITPLLVNSKLTKGGAYDFFQFLGATLSYKRQLIMWLISIILLKVVASTLGIYEAGGCLMAILFLAGLTKVYSKYIPDCVKSK